MLFRRFLVVVSLIALFAVGLLQMVESLHRSERQPLAERLRLIERMQHSGCLERSLFCKGSQLSVARMTSVNRRLPPVATLA